jgi:hypothetical protein
MTNRDIFSKGKIIDKFIALNPDDPDNDYTSCSVEYNNTLYEVIIDKHNTVLYPDEESIIISNDLKTLLNTPVEEDNDKPLIQFTFDKKDESDDSDFEFPNYIL